jgi:predicted Zn-dependent peptidase
MAVQITTLPNGLRVATDTMEGFDSAAIGLWVAVGTRYEEEAENGIAHLVEHMLFKGTKRRSAFEISAEMENVGGHMNAYTTRESTTYHARVLKDDVPLAADILCDMMRNATLEESELERERGVIIQEIGQSYDQPDDIIFDHAQKKFYPHSGLGRPVLGTEEIIRSLPRARLQNYIEAHYTADQMIFAASGGVEHGQIVGLAQKYLSDLRPKAATVRDKTIYGGGDAREARDIEQLHALIMFEGVSYYEPDYYGLSVLSTLLGGGMSSRLFQEVREKRGLVYSIYSYVAAYRDGGQFGIYAGTDPKRIQELLPVVAEQMQLLTQEVTEEELKRAKAQLRSSLFMAQESAMNRAEKIAYNLLIHNRIVPSKETLDKIEAVSVADIKRLALRLLKGKPVSAFVGPLEQVPEGDKVEAIFRA